MICINFRSLLFLYLCRKQSLLVTMNFFTIIDYVLGPIILIFIIILARVRQNRKLDAQPEYAYFTKGIYAKLFGAISFLLIYTLYYGGGDTTNYYFDATCMVRMMLYDFPTFWKIMKEGMNITNYFLFNEITNWPVYWREDSGTFWVVRIATVVVFFSAGSLVVSTLMFATISFGGAWQLYKLFISEFPDLKKEMATAAFFIPSVYFWGSGIMKDTVTLACVGYYSFAVYSAFIRREKVFWNILVLVLASFFILKIKPYIFFALVPGTTIWIVNHYTRNISNKMIKVLAGPFMLLLSVGGGYLVLASMSNLLGTYSVDKVLERAVITNSDLKADYYAGNSFDIGEFEPTIPSMLAKAPAAINVALFRPYLWEAKNIVMVLSGIEGLFILIFTLLILFRVKIIGLFFYLNRSHLLVFCLIFSLFFSFSVGISTSNFGSLVRYRIPALPFFIAAMYIIDYYEKERRKLNELNNTQQPFGSN